MSSQHDSSATEPFNKLIQFRQAAYECLGNTRDALFELCDAVIAMPTVQSFAELSGCRYYRREWPSLEEALHDGRPDREGLMWLYLQHIACDKGSIRVARLCRVVRRSSNSNTLV